MKIYCLSFKIIASLLEKHYSIGNLSDEVNYRKYDLHDKSNLKILFICHI